MPTTNLGLPLITGNQSADVVRDLNALAEAVDLNAVGSTDLQEVTDDLTTHLADDVRHVTDTERTAWNAKYTKPSSGIPLTDLNSADVESLSKSYKGALVTGLGQTIPNNTVYTPSFSSEIIDTGGFFNDSQPTRLTIPPGVSKVRLYANLAFGATTQAISIGFRKNGTGSSGGIPKSQIDAPYGSGHSNSISSGAINCVEGDYFDISLFTTGGAAQTISGSAYTYFEIEVLE